MIGRTYAINGITFNQTDVTGLLVPDGNGVMWFAGDLTGWDAPGDLRVSLAERMGPGQVQEEGQLTGLLLTLDKILVAAPSEELRYKAIRQFQSAFRLRKGEQASLVVTEDIARKVNVVRASGKPNTVMAPGPGSAAPFNVAGTADSFDAWWIFQAQVPLVATDPKRYSVLQHSTPITAAIVPIVNVGDFPAPWTAVITGGVTGDVLTVNGKSITLTDTVTAIPSPLNIDSNIRSATNNAGLNEFQVIRGDYQWGYLDPGTTGVNYTGSGSCTLLWNDTWA